MQSYCKSGCLSRTKAVDGRNKRKGEGRDVILEAQLRRAVVDPDALVGQRTLMDESEVEDWEVVGW